MRTNTVQQVSSFVRKGVDNNDSKFVPSSRDVEQNEPDFERSLQTVLDGMKQYMRGSLQAEGIGPPYDPNALSEADDRVPRGAYFLLISAKAMTTIEFLQQEWINDGNFMSLGGEREPIIGLQDEGAAFTIPRDPVRRVVHGIETFNLLRGGEYFCMPSLSGLKWVGELG